MDIMFGGLIASKAIIYSKHLARFFGISSHYNNYNKKVIGNGRQLSQKNTLFNHFSTVPLVNTQYNILNAARSTLLDTTAEKNEKQYVRKMSSLSDKSEDEKAIIKSQPIPEVNVGPIIEAVAENFNDVVYNNGKDTMVLFYAFWCRRCKLFSQVYDELGLKLKHEKVDIVKIDAVSNDIPKNFKVYFYPTLYWLPEGFKDTPLKYKGGLEIEDLIQFIAQNTETELVGYDRSGNKKFLTSHHDLSSQPNKQI